jgi:hypothetical protein
MEEEFEDIKWVILIKINNDDQIRYCRNTLSHPALSKHQ